MNDTPLEAPLYDALHDFAQRHTLRLHMPGHKGIGLPVPELKGYASIDFTELSQTGNLYEPDGLIDRAEGLWAEYWGAESCLFLTGGSTQGLHTALNLLCCPGDKILMDRESHRCLHTGMALLDLHPVWLQRRWMNQGGVSAAVEPGDVAKLLSEHHDCRAVCVTSPTYYGVCSDVDAIAAVCHSFGAKLLVDGAHGAHLPVFYQRNPYHDADLTVVSAHKTLPAPGQSALLFANGFTLDELRHSSLLFATSSPSYPMMAALDRLRTWLAAGGEERTFLAAGAALHLREKFPCIREEGAVLDPMRVTLLVEDGYALASMLEDMDVYPEMADAHHVVLIFSGADGEEQFNRLDEVLTALGLGYQTPYAPATRTVPEIETVRSPREAVFGAKRQVILSDAEGEIAAEQIAPYPPGVPVVAPGERISKKHLDYLREMGYNKLNEWILVCHEG